MPGNSDEFTKAAADVKNLKSVPNDTEMLELYAHYKQATIGDTNTDRPGMLDFKGKAKWDAWKAVEGMSKDEAEKKYIEIANKLITTYGK